MMITKKKTPHLLMILDGFGNRQDAPDNAVTIANTPNLDAIKQHYPHGLISASSEDVGLPEGQFGNSEVGHMNIGAGRVLFQDSTRISMEIRNQEFFTNEVLVNAIQAANKKDASVHILGLLSDGGVHAHQDHIEAMCLSAAKQGAKQIYVHCFLDGRDTPPKSAAKYLAKLMDYIDVLNEEYDSYIQIASMCGRYFAMDRDNRWERVQQAYELIVDGTAVRSFSNPIDALNAAYHVDETDEFVSPTSITAENKMAVKVQDGDAIIFMNFRSDRARELSQAFVYDDFNGFVRKQKVNLSAFVMMTKYSDDLDEVALTSVAYKPTKLINTMGEYLQNNNKTQLRIAETEKYAHVTFFFSGGREEEYQGETRILVPSPNVKTYDLKPEMSAYEVTEKLKAAIESGEFDFLVVNFANGDMVGHTGVLEATVKAVEALDDCIGIICEAIKHAGGHMIITADHGNCEQMLDPESGQVHTQHTTQPVPCIYVGDKQVTVREGGKLSDLAPTFLNLMGMEKPKEMMGNNLLIEK